MFPVSRGSSGLTSTRRWVVGRSWLATFAGTFALRRNFLFYGGFFLGRLTCTKSEVRGLKDKLSKLKTFVTITFWHSLHFKECVSCGVFSFSFLIQSVYARLIFWATFGVLLSHLTPKGWVFLAESLSFLQSPSFFFQMVCFTWNECNIYSKCDQFGNISEQNPTTPLKMSQ